MREAHGKLYREDIFGAMDTSYWRRATFNDVCLASTSTCSPDTEDQSCVDHLFTFSEARKSVLGFYRIFPSSEGETSLSFPAIFEAIITTDIDSFKSILQNLCEGVRFIGEESQQAQARDSVHHPVSTKSYARFEKGVVIPHKSAMRFKLLFPKAAVRLRS